MRRLTPREMVQEWTGRKARGVYYLFGEETALKESAVKKLEAAYKPESFNFSVRDAELSEMAEVLDEARTAPMLAEQRFVVIKRVEKLKKEPMGRLLDYLADPCPSACLVLFADWPREKKDPLPEALGAEAAMVDFSPMTEPQAAAYLNDRLLAGGVKSDREALELLVETVGTSASVLDTEAEKIVLYMHGQERLFEPRDALALAGSSRDQDPYELPNAIRDRDPKAALAAAGKALEAGDEPLALLSKTARAIEALLKTKRIAASGEGQAACYAAGISPGQYHHLQSSALAFTEEKLVRSLRRCLEAEELLKSSSKRDPSLVVRMLIYEIASGR